MKVIISLRGFIAAAAEKNVGIALLGLDREMMKKTLEASDTKSISGKEDPITYDDVIDAHAFFSSLGDDWTKFIPQEYKN